VEKWRVPNARLVSLMPEAERAKATEIEKEAKAAEVERLKKEGEFIGEILERELTKRPEEVRDSLREAYQTEVKKRTPEQVALLKAHPTVASLKPGSLYLYEKKMADELGKMATQAAGIRKRKPVEEFVPALTETPAADKLPVTFLFHRGDPDQPREQVEPGELTILASLRPTAIPPRAPSLSTSGRRLALAQSLTDGTHPLTARVLVNRVWHHHFGRGIVASLADFGQLGERPTHPELLDWLASEFAAQGWSLKKLHRLIVTSSAYRQSSAREPQKDRVDPDNRLVGRMNVRRLEAETIRDAMLVVSGKLNPKMFGAPVPIMTDEHGQVIVGVDTNDNAGRPTGKFVPLNGEEFRRSLYVQMRRSKPLQILETFDLPRMEPNCELRSASTVAPQSLTMMNGEFTLAQSKFLAERIVQESGASVEAQAQRAWSLAFGRGPSDMELEAAAEFISRQTEHFQTNPVKVGPAGKGKEPPPTDPPMQALATFCQALLTSNPFLYVD
ncbi:MAG: DUF1553 domain-containing protein, partial [Verrucomicrobiota bacterium]|nr:DUF1553 domain-containing protein [Verrucomicrobiota bacterium]